VIAPLRRESPDMILGDKPFISEVVLLQITITLPESCGVAQSVDGDLNMQEQVIYVMNTVDSEVIR
jgi:hypothetical protein